LLTRIMATVLGFVLHHDDDLLGACPLRSDWSGEFRKAPPTPFGTSYCEIVGSDEIRSCAPRFFPTIWFQEGACYLLPSCDMFHSMMKLEAENVMEARS
jgi:hypothetical protein